MSNTMKTRCPNCEAYGSHDVEKTLPKWYYKTFSEKRLKNECGRGMLFRIRLRRCNSCRCLFNTNEIAGKDFDNVMILWEKDHNSLQKAEETMKKEKKKQERLMRQYDTLLKHRGKGLLNSVFQSVDMLGFDSEILLAIKRLKAHGITRLGDLLLYSKSELVGEEVLSDESWNRIAAIFEESGIILEDDMNPLLQLKAFLDQPRKTA